MPKSIHIAHWDTNDDDITDCVVVLSDDFKGENLIGDYRGVQLCRIDYIAGRPESVDRAVEIACYVVSAELTKGGYEFREDVSAMNPYKHPYKPSPRVGKFYRKDTSEFIPGRGYVRRLPVCMTGEEVQNEIDMAGGVYRNISYTEISKEAWESRHG